MIYMKNFLNYKIINPNSIYSHFVNHAVPTKRSSHYIKGVLIGAMSTLGLAIFVLFAFLWVWLLSKKERGARRYTEVKKQVERETSRLNIVFNFLFTDCSYNILFLLV